MALSFPILCIRMQKCFRPADTPAAHVLLSQSGCLSTPQLILSLLTGNRYPGISTLCNVTLFLLYPFLANHDNGCTHHSGCRCVPCFRHCCTRCVPLSLRHRQLFRLCIASVLKSVSRVFADLLVGTRASQVWSQMEARVLPASTCLNRCRVCAHPLFAVLYSQQSTRCRYFSSHWCCALQ